MMSGGRQPSSRHHHRPRRRFPPTGGLPRRLRRRAAVPCPREFERSGTMPPPALAPCAALIPCGVAGGRRQSRWTLRVMAYVVREVGQPAVENHHAAACDYNEVCTIGATVPRRPAGRSWTGSPWTPPTCQAPGRDFPAAGPCLSPCAGSFDTGRQPSSVPAGPRPMSTSPAEERGRRIAEAGFTAISKPVHFSARRQLPVVDGRAAGFPGGSFQHYLTERPGGGGVFRDPGFAFFCSAVADRPDRGSSSSGRSAGTGIRAGSPWSSWRPS